MATGQADSSPRAVSGTVQLTQDTVLHLPDGAFFEGAKGWTVTRRAQITTLRDPDGLIGLTLFQIATSDGEQAVREAWRCQGAASLPEVSTTVEGPPRDGWESLVQFDYRTAAKSNRVQRALAFRKAQSWTVLIIDAQTSALEARGAQVLLAATSLRPAGHVDENYSNTKPHVLDPERLQSLRRFVEHARQSMRIPGASLAVVQDGKIVLQEAFGQKQLGHNAPVTVHTRFLVGSSMKALTTFMMARLVDKGLFTWDTPMVKVAPSFALGDPQATQMAQVRHTVCACTGMPRQDMWIAFAPKSQTAETMLARLKTMRPTTEFGETFQYSNEMIAAGGYLTAQTAEPGRTVGEAYNAVMQSLVFDPLGMTATTFDFAQALRGDYAAPHGVNLYGQFETIDVALETFSNAVRPAGGGWSTAGDMARFVMAELAHGQNAAGQTLVSEPARLARYQPQVRISDKLSYGLGLMLEQDCGINVVHHGGNMTGFTSEMLWLPEHNVGLVLLSNARNANALGSVVRRRLLELLLDAPERAEQELDFAVRKWARTWGAASANVEPATDPARMGPLTGSYKHPELGTISVAKKKDGWWIAAGAWESPLGQRREPDDSVVLVPLGPPLPDELVLIASQEQGKPALVLETQQNRLVFVKVDP